MNPVECDELDGEGQQIRDQLRELLGYRFWYPDQANQPRTRWFPNIDSTDRDYGHIQQNMARDMAKRLTQLKQLGQLAASMPSPEPITPAQRQPSALCDPPIPPFQGHQLVMINGGSRDASLVQDIARTLAACEGLGRVVPLMAQDRRADYKPSELLHDLRENLKLATAVLMVFRSGPVGEVHEQLREYTKAATRRPERVPSLDICQLGDQPLNFHPPGTRVHRVTDGTVVDCACDFARGLRT